MDDGDLDRNGIPDAIQRDPVVVPPEPEPFGVFDPDPGLPGITTPIEATAGPQPEPATPADLQQQAREFEMLSGGLNETLKAIGDALNTAARKG